MRKWVSQPLTDSQWVQDPLKHHHIQLLSLFLSFSFTVPHNICEHQGVLYSMRARMYRTMIRDFFWIKRLRQPLSCHMVVIERYHFLWFGSVHKATPDGCTENKNTVHWQYDILVYLITFSHFSHCIRICVWRFPVRIKTWMLMWMWFTNWILVIIIIIFLQEHAAFYSLYCLGGTDSRTAALLFNVNY